MAADVAIGIRRDIMRIQIRDSRFDAVIPIAAGKQEPAGTFTHFNLLLYYIFFFIKFFSKSSCNSCLLF